MSDEVKQYSFEYTWKDKTFSLFIPASSQEEALGRVLAISSTAEYLGVATRDKDHDDIWIVQQEND